MHSSDPGFHTRRFLGKAPNPTAPVVTIAERNADDELSGPAPDWRRHIEQWQRNIWDGDITSHEKLYFTCPHRQPPAMPQHRQPRLDASSGPRAGTKRTTARSSRPATPQNSEASCTTSTTLLCTDAVVFPFPTHRGSSRLSRSLTVSSGVFPSHKECGK